MNDKPILSLDHRTISDMVSERKADNEQVTRSRVQDFPMRNIRTTARPSASQVLGFVGVMPMRLKIVFETNSDWQLQNHS